MEERKKIRAKITLPAGNESAKGSFAAPLGRRRLEDNRPLFNMRWTSVFVGFSTSTRWELREEDSCAMMESL